MFTLKYLLTLGTFRTAPRKQQTLVHCQIPYLTLQYSHHILCRQITQRQHILLKVTPSLSTSRSGELPQAAGLPSDGSPWLALAIFYKVDTTHEIQPFTLLHPLLLLSRASCNRLHELGFHCHLLARIHHFFGLSSPDPHVTVPLLHQPHRGSSSVLSSTGDPPIRASIPHRQREE